MTRRSFAIASALVCSPLVGCSDDGRPGSDIFVPTGTSTAGIDGGGPGPGPGGDDGAGTSSGASTGAPEDGESSEDGDPTLGEPDLPDSPPANPQCEGLPRVVYMDDGGVPNDDPNGVQDLAIVLGWRDQVELLAIGSTSWNAGSAAFLQGLVEEAGASIPVLTDQVFVDTIISEARAMAVCDGRKLNIAIGGEWFKVMYALQQAPDIAPLIHVAGLGGHNIRTDTTPEGIPRDAYDYIVAQVGEQDIFRIDDQGDAPPGVPDFRDAYEVEPGYSVADLDAFYDANLRPLLQRIPDPQNPAINIADEASFYISHTRFLNLHQGEGDGTNGSKVRIADFLTVAHVIWGDAADFDIFDKDDVYPEIASGLATLD
ncbi:MAG: hypothetical protein AAF721_35725 [Myxococcota bacterium]